MKFVSKAKHGGLGTKNKTVPTAKVVGERLRARCRKVQGPWERVQKLNHGSPDLAQSPVVRLEIGRYEVAILGHEAKG